MKNRLVTTALGVSVAALIAGAASANPYAEYEGTTLIVNFPAHPHYNAAMKVLPEFTRETGIEVEVDQLPYLKMRERQTLELTQSSAQGFSRRSTALYCLPTPPTRL